ncbi:MAG: NAD-dependent epimerase/dehydratase family protein [Desulfobacterales bacterium]|nr:NAD-dependent epimerase/dehydratase family protein [Desulfobacterales bacterium]
MLILNHISFEPHAYPKKIVLIFGFGLLGWNIVDCLNIRKSFVIHSLQYSWKNSKDRALQNATILKFLTDNVKDKAKIDSIHMQISILWSAGKGGFGMNTGEAATEIDAFRDVIVLAKDIRRIFPYISIFFHMLSSAGGLYEGHCNVTPDTPPHPIRPYGFLKLEQEKYASTLSDIEVNVLIYRLSSVYGYAGNWRRLGLVPTLLRNAREMKVSCIFGRIDTLRDYVLASDVGRFIAASIMEPDHGYNVFTLASGKPSTVFEILRSVESLLHKKLYLQFIATDINSAHNSYSRSVLPKTWKSTDLQTGIRHTYLELIGRPQLSFQYLIVSA